MRRLWLPVGLAAIAAACSPFRNDGAADDVRDASIGGGPADDAGAPDGSAPSRPAYLVVAGGDVTTNGTTAHTRMVEIAEIHDDGTLGAFVRGPDLPSERFRLSAIGAEGALYVFGGFTTNVETSSVLSSKRGADGTFGAFVELAPLPDFTSDVPPFVRAGRLYVFSPTFEKAFSAGVTKDGLGGWQSANGLGANGWYGYAVTAADRVFLIGEQRRLLASSFGSAGEVMPWHDAMLPLPLAATDQLGVGVADGAHLYLVGGVSVVDGGSDEWVTDTYVADVDGNGAVAAWRRTEPFLTKRTHYCAVVHAGHLYVIGGGSTAVTFTTIHADGSLAPWQSTSSLSADRISAGCTAVP